MSLHDIVKARLAEVTGSDHGGTHHGGHGDVYFRALLLSHLPVVGYPNCTVWTRYGVATRYKDEPGRPGSDEWTVAMRSTKQFSEEVTGPILFQRLGDVLDFIDKEVKNPFIDVIPITVEIKTDFFDQFRHGLHFIFPTRTEFERLVPDFEEALKTRRTWGTPRGPMTVIGRDETHYAVEVDATIER